MNKKTIHVTLTEEPSLGERTLVLRADGKLIQRWSTIAVMLAEEAFENYKPAAAGQVKVLSEKWIEGDHLGAVTDIALAKAEERLKACVVSGMDIQIAGMDSKHVTRVEERTCVLNNVHYPWADLARFYANGQLQVLHASEPVDILNDQVFTQVEVYRGFTITNKPYMRETSIVPDSPFTIISAAGIIVCHQDEDTIEEIRDTIDVIMDDLRDGDAYYVARPNNAPVGLWADHAEKTPPAHARGGGRNEDALHYSRSYGD